MRKSTKMFFEQSHLTGPSSVWLHVNGVSLNTDIQPYQPPVHTYDYRTKHLQSPVQPPSPPVTTPSTIVPCSITMIDGPYINNNINKPYPKLANTDMSKKFFIDRHIKKAKSLPGLIKGTALSRHTPLQSSTFTSPAPVNSVTNNTIPEDQLPLTTVDNEDDSLPVPPVIEHQPETRRPRVYFADFNNIQFIEDNHDTPQKQQTPHPHTHRRHRRRLSKKTSNTNGTNQALSSTHQLQIPQNPSRPLSRQPNPSMAQELSIKKQQLLISPRVRSSRITHLPDILNQSLPIEASSNENSNGKYTLQREKPFIRLPKPTIEIPIAPVLEQSSEDFNNINNNQNARSSPTQDSHIQLHESEASESNNAMLYHSTPSISSTSINRQRPSLRTISLRQQFILPVKLKTTNLNQNQQLNNSVINTRRSASLKHSVLRMHDDNDDFHSNVGSLLTTENRPMTSTKSGKQLKRSDVIHMNSKNVLGGNTTNDSTKPYSHEPRYERFQNLLTIVRPPYAAGNGTSSNFSSIPLNDSTIQPNYHPPRSSSARETRELQTTSNTIIV